MRDLPLLKDMREAEALSQRQLAKLSGVAHDTIGQLERGERKARPSTVRKLAAALQIEPSVLSAKSWDDVGREDEQIAQRSFDELFKQYQSWSEAGAREQEEARNQEAREQEARKREARKREARWRKAQEEQEARNQEAREQEARKFREAQMAQWRKAQEREHAWAAAGKWAEYFVSGKAVLKNSLKDVYGEEPTEVQKDALRGRIERDFLADALRLPNAATADEELSIAWMKLDSHDPQQTLEVAQQALRTARDVIEALRNKQASYEAIPSRYYDEPASRHRIEQLRLALKRHRKEVIEAVPELLELHREATRRLEDQLNEMREEGDRLETLMRLPNI